MPLTTLMAASLITGLWPFHPSQVQKQVYTLPVWSFSQSRDRFTGDLRCRLYAGPRSDPPVTYAAGAVSFHLARRLNTLQAEYRLDGGPARRWQDRLPALTRIGVSLDNTSMDNPTGGLVTLPVAELAGVHTVTIRPRPRAQPRTFSIDGLPDALEAARARGCDDRAFSR